MASIVETKMNSDSDDDNWFIDEKAESQLNEQKPQPGTYSNALAIEQKPPKTVEYVVTNVDPGHETDEIDSIGDASKSAPKRKNGRSSLKGVSVKSENRDGENK